MPRSAIVRILAVPLVVAPFAAHAPLEAQAADTAKKAWEFSGNAGLSQTGGNADLLALTVGNKYKLVRNGWTLLQDFATFYGEADNRVNANFWQGGVRGERALSSRIALFVATRFDRNVLQGIARRFEEGAGLSIHAVDRPRDHLRLTVGASAMQVGFTPGVSTIGIPRSFPAARLGADYKHSFTQVAYLQQLVEVLPNLSNADALLVNTETALVAPISKNIGLKVGYVVRYNGLPPVRAGRSLKTTDTFFSSGLTFSY